MTGKPKVLRAMIAAQTEDGEIITGFFSKGTVHEWRAVFEATREWEKKVSSMEAEYAAMEEVFSSWETFKSSELEPSK